MEKQWKFKRYSYKAARAAKNVYTIFLNYLSHISESINVCMQSAI